MKTIFTLVLLVASAAAQSVAPVINECGHKCSGQFAVTNNGLLPMTAVITSFSFSIVNAQPVFRPLDAGVVVTLSEQSTRIAPGDVHTFDYKIRCATLPCPVTFYATVTTGKPAESGMLLKLALPHVVYVCEKEHNCRITMLKKAGLK
jgi:hypothetical protein